METKEKEKRYMKIIYKDENDDNKDVVMEIDDYYYNAEETSIENVLDVFSSISDDGGFLLNKTTIIPFHRILSCGPHVIGEDKKENDNLNKKIEFKHQSRRRRHSGYYNKNSHVPTKKVDEVKKEEDIKIEKEIRKDDNTYAV